MGHAPAMTERPRSVAPDELCGEIVRNPKSPGFGRPCTRPRPCEHHEVGPHHIRADVVARVLEQVIAEHEGQIALVAADMAASGLFTEDAATRLMFAIRRGERSKIGLGTADKILVALDLSELWYTDPDFAAAAERELAVVGDSLDPVDVCAECGWTVDWNRSDAGVREGDRVLCSVCYSTVHRGFPFGPWTRAELLETYRRYVRQGLTLRELVMPVWKQKGYKHPSSGLTALTQAWTRNGWPMRTRSESKSLATKRRGPKLMANRSLSEAEARRLHPLHWDDWQSINSLAKEHHERLSMTQSALCSQLSYTWKLLGLPRHDRIEMTVRASTKHGHAPRRGRVGYKRWLMNERAGTETRNPICVAVTAKGKPCGHRAANGTVYCQSHDPARRDAIVARVNAMRARSPLHDPRRIEPLPPLQAELRAYFEWAGGWAELAAATGRDREWLSRTSTTVQQKNISRQVAAELRSAIATLTASAALPLAA